MKKTKTEMFLKKERKRTTTIDQAIDIQRRGRERERETEEFAGRRINFR
jgi:hypothetical protein